MKTVGVFIGRFQPLHNGHLKSLKTILSMFDKVVVVLGSHNSLRTAKNPWTAEEREFLISKSVPITNLRFIWQEDRPNNNYMWSQEIQQKVKTMFWDQEYEFHITGCYKDSSTFYLGLFPNWKTSLLPLEEPLNATDIRYSYFGGFPDDMWNKDLPPASVTFLLQFKETNLYKELSRLRLLK